MIASNDFNFSFSGLKTSLRYFLESGFKQEDLSDICASFQEAVVDVLVTKLARAAQRIWTFPARTERGRQRERSLA